MKKTKIFGICILAMLVLIALCPTVSKADTAVTITFKDQILAERMEGIMKKKGDTNAKLDGLTLTTTQETIDTITVIDLNTNTNAEESNKIADITGLEMFTNLEILNVRSNKISDLTPISNLTKLKELRISNNNISNLKVLSKLNSLEELEAYSCNLTTLEGIENLTNLKILNVQNLIVKNYSNKITDITPIKNLTKLVKFNISNDKKNNYSGNNYSGNKISDLSALSARTEMTDLRFSSNEISDISIISNMKKLEYLFADGNCIENIPEDILKREFKTRYMRNQTIVKQVKLSEYNTNEITLDLPQIFILAKKNNLLTEDEKFVAENAKLSDGSTKVILTKESIESGKNSVKITGDDGSRGNFVGTTVTYVQAFEVISVTKEPETSTDGKVKVTITVNKELDPDKIPTGWTISDDKKSISKEFDKNGTEDVTLTDKDGNTVTQKVDISNINNEEKFKVTDEKQESDGNGKIKVTISVNKELDPNKIPEGWTLSDDGKSISKVMDEGASETVVLYAKDGSKIEYTVTAKKTGSTGEKKPDKIPQAGSSSIILFVISAFIVIGILRFKKYNDLKLK